MKNKGTWIIVGIVAAFVLLIAGIFVSTNNRAVSLEEQVFTADSDIQAQEKRRTDLIYNLTLPDEFDGLTLHKRYRYGKVAVTVYRSPAEEEL